MVGLYSTTRTASLGPKFVEFKILTQDNPPDANVREAGYVQLKLLATNFGVLPTYVGTGATALGYEIVGTEYLEKPVGFNTVVGITSGYWVQSGSSNYDYVNIPDVGAASTLTMMGLAVQGGIDAVGVVTGSSFDGNIALAKVTVVEPDTAFAVSANAGS